MKYLCFDIGGTFIKYGLFSASGEALSATAKVATGVEETTNHILQQVLEIIGQVQQQEKIAGVAISTAGVVNALDGSIRFAGPTIPGYTGTPLKEAVESFANVPCTVINDVNAACLGEFWQKFAKQNVQTLACLTIGTGVGGAVIVNGQLHNGYTDMAGEIGYLPINGQHFQDLASTTALLNRIKDLTGETLSGEQFFVKITEGVDTVYQQCLRAFIADLATGILSIIYLLNPEVIVIGGGIMAQEAIILPLLEEALKKQVIDERFLSAKIQAAALGNDAGMLGALYQLLQQ